MPWMKKFLYKAFAKFVTWFGNIKVYRFPFFVIYDPDDYNVDG